MQLVIDTTNTRLSVKNKLFFIENQSVQQHISPKRVSSIAITVNCSLNASVIKLAAQNQVPIYFFNNFGTIQARTYSPYFIGLASLRKKQLLFNEYNEATQWVIAIIQKKINRQKANIKRYSKNRTSINEEINTLLKHIEKSQKKLAHYNQDPIVQCRNNIMGIEGSCSKMYYKALSLIIPKEYGFTGRNRRPATDFFNASLNYLYGMTYSIVESGAFAKGLDPLVGLLHVENYQRTALVFDLIEPIRPLIDQLLIELCLQNELQPTHFIKKEQGYWLHKTGKRIIIPKFNNYLYKRFRLDNKVRKLKDIIYAESFDLGKLIENTVNLS